MQRSLVNNQPGQERIAVFFLRDDQALKPITAVPMPARATMISRTPPKMTPVSGPGPVM
jgi:hypothetical protein